MAPWSLSVRSHDKNEGLGREEGSFEPVASESCPLLYARLVQIAISISHDISMLDSLSIIELN